MRAQQAGARDRLLENKWLPTWENLHRKQKHLNPAPRQPDGGAAGVDATGGHTAAAPDGNGDGGGGGGAAATKQVGVEVAEVGATNDAAVALVALRASADGDGNVGTTTPRDEPAAAGADANPPELTQVCKMGFSRPMASHPSAVHTAHTAHTAHLKCVDAEWHWWGAPFHPTNPLLLSCNLLRPLTRVL